jgi:hypothetical protein
MFGSGSKSFAVSGIFGSGDEASGYRWMDRCFLNSISRSMKLKGLGINQS